MNNHKIAFIIYVSNEDQFNICNSYLNSLEIPSGIEVEVISVGETKNIALAYNVALNRTDAKYKVYLHSNTFILNKNIIKDLLEIFAQNSQIGVIGLVGAKRLPSDGLWRNDVGKVGEVNILRNGTTEYYKLNTILEKYEIVEAVDGLMMATQYDIRWKEEIFDGLYFYDISECLEYKSKGFQIVVPKQEKTWCIQDCSIENDSEQNNEAEKYRKIFLKEYSIIQNRSFRDSEDLFNFNKEEAMDILMQNRKTLENYFIWMKNSLLYSDYESISRNAYGFAAMTCLNGCHPDFYISPEIENMLLECAKKIPSEDYIITSGDSKKRRILHVLSEGYSVGGHTRLAKNWIKSDTDSIHSLVTTWRIDTTPQWLFDEVTKSGGWIANLQTVSDKYIERAAKLRKMAYEWADIVVLHVHMMDPIPVMAFGLDDGPPIIFMNHGDHVFWLGASIADLVVDLRVSGQKLTLNRRSCNNSCILPIPLEAKKTFNKNQIRQKYNIKENETVILTIASNYKFRSINNYNYIDIIKEIVKNFDNCSVYIVGPSDTGKWHEVNIETAGKIKALGVLTEIDECYQMADIYLDSFMMGSMTAVLDASKYGLPIIKFSNSHCPMQTEFGEELEVCNHTNINDILQEINKIRNGDIETYKKFKKANDSIVKNHITDTKERIKNIYDLVEPHKVKRELTISNSTEDHDLFWSLLISKGIVY